MEIPSSLVAPLGAPPPVPQSGRARNSPSIAGAVLSPPSSPPVAVPSTTAPPPGASPQPSLPHSASGVAAAPPQPPNAEGSFTREVFLFTVAIGIFLALAALAKVITNGWPMVYRTLFAPFSVCVIILLAAGAIAATTMSNHPTFHLLAKVAARVSLIFGIMILEIPFIQMAAGLSALVFAPIFMMATLIVLGYIWWRSEPDVVRALYSPFSSCFLRSHRQVQVTPEAADYNV
uniref:Uncharacterized protein n=1 Tax=Oryza punctata TaxID=4537 RepID=A0A0E0LHP5_ORYPU